jgi:two-component system, NtrC family, response regulator AtoC
VKNETPIANGEMEEIGDGRFFVASSPVMRTLRAQAELLAKVNVPVLIVGERGSGTELTARLIHKLSVRSAHIFLKVDCATFPPDVLEREMLGDGDEQDAFRATMHTGSGQYDPVSKGTILLDEIAEMPPELQAVLLRIVQDGQFYKLGSEDPARMKPRILSSTTVDTENRTYGKDLRSDLYSCLSTFTIHVPPLRQRKEEISLLIDCFTQRATSRYALPIRRLSPTAREACERYSWPGNVAELENFVIRYLVMGDEALASNESGLLPASAWSDILAQSPISLPFAGAAESADAGRASSSESALRNVRGRAERDAIASALEKTHWNRKAAARLLLISYRALLYKIRQYHLNPPDCLSTLHSTSPTSS